MFTDSHAVDCTVYARASAVCKYTVYRSTHRTVQFDVLVLDAEFLVNETVSTFVTFSSFRYQTHCESA